MTELLEEKIGALLRERKLKLAVAESCTGGLIGDRVTNIAGSSDYFLGGVVAYAYEVKADVLGVPWGLLAQYGAVSRETVLDMAQDVCKLLKADVGLSVSGIAGPGGGLPTKPVGLTWVGLSAADFRTARCFVWEGDRIANKQQSAQAALQLLYDYLVGTLETTQDCACPPEQE